MTLVLGGLPMRMRSRNQALVLRKMSRTGLRFVAIQLAVEPDAGVAPGAIDGCRPIPSDSAVSATDNPAKKRRRTTAATSGVCSSKRRIASSSAKISSWSQSSAKSRRWIGTGRAPFPRFTRPRPRACSIRMRRIASAAAWKKWARSDQRLLFFPARRRYASWTSAVACSVCPAPPSTCVCALIP